MVNLRARGHLVSRGTSALSQESLKSKGGGKTSIHYNGDSATAELLRIIISVNQLRSTEQYQIGAQQISDSSSSRTGKSVAELNDESESRVLPCVNLNESTFDQCSSASRLVATSQQKI